MRIEIQELPSIQHEDACGLFNQVFGLALTPRHWRWKFQQGPRLGSVNMVARLPDGELIGHLGASVLAGVQQGRSLPMAQVCDLMIAAGMRGGYGRAGIYPGLAAAVQQKLAERFAGVYAYGFAGIRPFQLGERMGFNRRLLVCEASTMQASARLGLVDAVWSAQEAGWDQERLQRLWNRLADRSVAPMVARTGEFMCWRYRDHPDQPYRLWILRRLMRDVGWLVTREMPAGELYVVDALLPETGPAPARSACLALRRALSGSATSLPVIKTWLAPRGCKREATPIVAGEYRVDRWHADLPTPAFQPGDTDVF